MRLETCFHAELNVVVVAANARDKLDVLDAFFALFGKALAISVWDCCVFRAVENDYFRANIMDSVDVWKDKLVHFV